MEDIALVALPVLAIIWGARGSRSKPTDCQQFVQILLT